MDQIPQKISQKCHKIAPTAYIVLYQDQGHRQEVLNKGDGFMCVKTGYPNSEFSSDFGHFLKV